ncbi:hypothetical protein [Streptantibioticus ferralitis]|uniref:hypothetical protein n=1 Tax=Streptantibioticus ferralitis TaxID=236510 RepID=UPI0027E2E9EB|nr:hypothetical protein [Streptantibioticus ferralitis]
MSLTASFTTPLGLRHPVALAPMGGSAGGELAAAVSNGGGLALVGGGRGDRDWLRRGAGSRTRGGRNRRRAGSRGAAPVLGVAGAFAGEDLTSGT